MKDRDWIYCNTFPIEVEYEPNGWSCPNCGGRLLNVLGTCATKIYKDENRKRHSN